MIPDSAVSQDVPNLKSPGLEFRCNELGPMAPGRVGLGTENADPNLMGFVQQKGQSLLKLGPGPKMLPDHFVGQGSIWVLRLPPQLLPQIKIANAAVLEEVFQGFSVEMGGEAAIGPAPQISHQFNTMILQELQKFLR